jgi:hypothetical protein
MANNTRSAGSAPSLPGTGFRASSTRVKRICSTLPVLPAKTVVEIEY